MTPYLILRDVPWMLSYQTNLWLHTNSNPRLLCRSHLSPNSAECHGSVVVSRHYRYLYWNSYWSFSLKWFKTEVPFIITKWRQHHSDCFIQVQDLQRDPLNLFVQSRISLKYYIFTLYKNNLLFPKITFSKFITLNIVERFNNRIYILFTK